MRISDWSSDVCSSDLHQSGGDADHDQRRPQGGPGARIARRQLRIEARECEDDRDLHQLRRLEIDNAEVEPALAAAADEAQQLDPDQQHDRSEEHTSELQSLMRISYAVFCLKKKNITTNK